MSAKKKGDKHNSKTSLQAKPFNKYLLAGLILVTVFIYFKSLNNQLTAWDDKNYVSENPDIQTLHKDSVVYTLKHTFSTNVMGNYHPLTMLSYCMEYAKFKLNPKPYHITNLLLHLLNSLLALCFICLLTQRQWAAFITALLFAIHPMHVESVAWVSERKDVLYSFFYLAGLCSYIFYLQKEKWKWHFYALTFLLFLLAAFSKGMAVSLPIVFFAVDYFLGRKITLKEVLEKIPFLIISLIFGILAIKAQTNALSDIAHYNFFDRILFSSYGLFEYLWKLAVPINLSCFYDYPLKDNGMYPPIFYLAPIVILAIAFFVYKSRIFGREIVFGFGFFLITIVLVLQILPVGNAIIADRYTYLPYIGIFFIIGTLINNLLENKYEKFQSWKTPAVIGLAVFSLICCFLSFQRSKVWHDTISLWTDAIEKFDKSPTAFKARGGGYSDTKQYDKALADYNRTIFLKSDYPDAYNDRGLVYFQLEKYDTAIADFSRAVELKKDYPTAYYNRGVAYFNFKKNREAVMDYSTAIQQNPKMAEAFNNRGTVYTSLEKFDTAITDFNEAINLVNNYSNAYYNRGLAYYALKKYDDAINDFSAAIRFSPRLALAYYKRGLVYIDLKKYNEAISDYTSAIDYSQKNSNAISNAYYNRGCAYDDLRKLDEAISDYTEAIQNNTSNEKAYYNRAVVYFSIQKYQQALEDAQKAKQFGYAVDPRFFDAVQSKIITH